MGMNPGDSKTTEVPLEKVFGSYREDMIALVDKSQFGDAGLEPEMDERLPIPQPDGSSIDVTVTDVTESGVTVDATILGGRTSDFRLIDIVYGAH